MNREEIRMQWESRIQAFHASGEKIAPWCKANQVNRQQLYAWMKKLDASHPSPSLHQVTFIPVQMTTEALPTWSPCLRIRIGAAIIEVNAGLEPALLREVVRALEVDSVC